MPLKEIDAWIWRTKTESLNDMMQIVPWITWRALSENKTVLTSFFFLFYVIQLSLNLCHPDHTMCCHIFPGSWNVRSQNWSKHLAFSLILLKNILVDFLQWTQINNQGVPIKLLFKIILFIFVLPSINYYYSNSNCTEHISKEHLAEYHYNSLEEAYQTKNNFLF